MEFLSLLGSRILIFFIKVYQLTISLLLNNSCRFNPTCSQYGIEVLHHFGFLKGIYLLMKRILKCHPLHMGGRDPSNTK